MQCGVHLVLTGSTDADANCSVWCTWCLQAAQTQMLFDVEAVIIIYDDCPIPLAEACRLFFHERASL